MTCAALASAAVATLVAAGCDDARAPRAGDRCTAAYGDSAPDPCGDDLWCAPDGACAARPGDGEVCDPAPCAEGLQCHIDKRCGTSRQAGEACASSVECAPGLACNQGELPALYDVGLCRGPAAEGEPCGFGHVPEDMLGHALPPDYDGIDRGDCAAGLSCAPVYPLPGSGETPPMCERSKGVACFFAGQCRLNGALALGTPCGRAEGCASGVCAIFTPPISAVPMPGFGTGGEWLGPNVGLCVAPEDAIGTCGRGDPCARDFTCLDRLCVPPHTQRPGEVCSDVAGVECAYGLVCDGRQCQYRP